MRGTANVRRPVKVDLLDVVAAIIQGEKKQFQVESTVVSFSQSKFETRCFQARVELAPAHLEVLVPQLALGPSRG